MSNGIHYYFYHIDLGPECLPWSLTPQGDGDEFEEPAEQHYRRGFLDGVIEALQLESDTPLHIARPKVYDYIYMSKVKNNYLALNY